MRYELNPKTKTWEIQDFPKAKSDCEAFIKNEGLLDVLIQSDEDKKAVKAARTIIRAKKDEIATLRKDLNKAVMGTFNDQAKELESLLDDADVKLKKKLDDYTASLPAPTEPAKPKGITLIVKSFDKSSIDRVMALAIELKCGVELK